MIKNLQRYRKNYGRWVDIYKGHESLHFKKGNISTFINVGQKTIGEKRKIYRKTANSGKHLRNTAGMSPENLKCHNSKNLSFVSGPMIGKNHTCVRKRRLTTRTDWR